MTQRTCSALFELLLWIMDYLLDPSSIYICYMERRMQFVYCYFLFFAMCDPSVPARVVSLCELRTTHKKLKDTPPAAFAWGKLRRSIVRKRSINTPDW